MVTTQHSFTAATIAAHRDAWSAIRAMPHLAWAAVFIVALQVGLGLLLKQVVPWNSLLGHELPKILHYALLTPFFIAVHRFIIVGEVTTDYRLDWHDRRFQLFFGWAFSLYALSCLTTVGLMLPKHWMIRALTLVAIVASAVILTRCCVLFPAIAVDAPGATPRNAFEDTKGHGWYIFFLFLVPFIPSFLLVALLGGFLVVLQPLWGKVLMVPIVGIGGVVWLTMAVTIASRLYQWLGNRLNDSA